MHSVIDSLINRDDGNEDDDFITESLEDEDKEEVNFDVDKIEAEIDDKMEREEAVNDGKEQQKEVEKVSDQQEYDLVVVGAGLSGLVFAERAYTLAGWKSLVIEKRDHIGGNCYDFVNEKGIRVSKYGLHLFHTESDRVWDYVQKFTKWMHYEHRVKGYVKDVDGNYQVVPIPPNQDTVNILFHENITSEEEMVKWLDARKPKYDHEPKDGEEMSLTRVGKDLYEMVS